MLILADRGDDVATAVAAAAAQRGDDVRWLTTTELLAGRWRHVVADGAVSTRIADRAGGIVDLDGHRGVLNRLSWVPAVPFEAAADRDYSLMERHALVLSALAGIQGPMVNRPFPPSLAGPLLGPAAWLALASRAGLPVRRTRLTTDARRWSPPGWEAVSWELLTGDGVGEPLHPSVPPGRRPAAWMEPITDVVCTTVVGALVLGAPDEAAAATCRALADAVHCTLLAVTLARRASDGAWVVFEADPRPPAVPHAAVEAVVDVLTAERIPVGSPR